MKFSFNEILELSNSDGGKFKIKNLKESYDFCEKFARSHYENFPVGSILVPKEKRKYFYAIYSIARISDDIADEFTKINKHDRIKLIDKFEELISVSDIQEVKNHPIIYAVRDTMDNCNIPLEPIKKLLIAFRMDIEFKQPNTWQELEFYCSLSANPIGELILRIFDNYNETTAKYSDAICTGLQLANFWQDLSRDLPIERFYIPIKKLEEFELQNIHLSNQNKINNLVNCFSDILDKTENYFLIGKNLLNYLHSKRLKAEIAFTIEGGDLILKKSRELGIELVNKRPNIKKFEFFKLLLKSILSMF